IAKPTVFPYTTLFRSKMRVQCEPLEHGQHDLHVDGQPILEQIVTDDEIGTSGTKIHGRQCRDCVLLQVETQPGFGSAPHSEALADRKSTRLNSSHQII